MQVTLEPPSGVRESVMRSLAEMPPDALESDSCQQTWKRLLYACTLFHAAIQERRKFGPLGWNIRYDFTPGDLECTLITLRDLLDTSSTAAGSIPWDALTYMTGQIIYGGRVTDDNDRTLLMSLLSTFVGPHVLHGNHTFTASSAYMVRSLIPVTVGPVIIEFR